MHIFTKSHASDLFTVFAFTLTPADLADPGSYSVAFIYRAGYNVLPRLKSDSSLYKGSDIGDRAII